MRDDPVTTWHRVPVDEADLETEVHDRPPVREWIEVHTVTHRSRIADLLAGDLMHLDPDEAAELTAAPIDGSLEPRPVVLEEEPDPNAVPLWMALVMAAAAWLLGAAMVGSAWLLAVLGRLR